MGKDGLQTVQVLTVRARCSQLAISSELFGGVPMKGLDVPVGKGEVGPSTVSVTGQLIPYTTTRGVFPLLIVLIERIVRTGLGCVEQTVVNALLVLIDEHEQSIYDGLFHASQASPDDALNQDDQQGEDASSGGIWYKLPSDRHSRGANLSFADGHVQTFHWNAPKKFGGYRQLATPGADSQDLHRLQSVLPHLR